MELLIALQRGNGVSAGSLIIGRGHGSVGKGYVLGGQRGAIRELDAVLQREGVSQMIVGQLKGGQIADNLALFINLYQPLKDGGAHIGIVEIVGNNGIEDARIPGQAHLQDVRAVG